jgi:quercetin dioxygenase-like cupin family protein
MNLYIDIDNTICKTNTDDPYKYQNATPITERITHINKLYDDGYTITYWTARGGASGIDYTELTTNQLKEWGCKYHNLKMNKPSFDLFIDDKCCNSDHYWKHLPKNLQMKQKSEIVTKGWGHEVIFVNNDKYCGKILHFNKGAKFSMHYHLIKIETWYVTSGKFIFKYINTKNADMITQTLEVGDVITNEIGQPHQIICEEEGDIFEVSTTHFESDSYRVFKGDSQLL